MLAWPGLSCTCSPQSLRCWVTGVKVWFLQVEAFSANKQEATTTSGEDPGALLGCRVWIKDTACY